ncbi:hypothetical protein Tco_0651809 [Tanacetum coccineum]|uniref:Reverse transcriptase domain-containing protein n=1 Tax=Tanacetum coccineum TaxID=301880 RepID=A0ABQ4WWF8_9ASTR
MVSASKDPLTFNDLMATPIDFSKYVLNGLKIENLTQDILLGPAFNLLKGTCSSNLSDPEVTYTTSITKTKVARYEIKGIEDMVPTLWSTIKHAKGDFVDLHLNDIEDMLLLAVQHKLFHLDGSDIVDFIMALQDLHEIEFKEPYTPSYDPPGIVYEDLDKQKRVLRADELYKFSDGTLKSVRDKNTHRVLYFLLDYNNGEA